MISSYPDLKDAVREWLFREDPETIARIPSFIAMAEAHFNRMLRLKEMTVRATTQAGSRYVKLPDDWLEARNVQRNDTGEPLEFKSMPEMDKLYAASERAGVPTAGPVYYGFVGRQMELYPAPTVGALVELELTYYGRIPSLSDDNPTNWLLEHSPDLYLYSTLIHSAPFLKDDSRMGMWQTVADRILMELEHSNNRATASGGPMTRPIGAMR